MPKWTLLNQASHLSRSVVWWSIGRGSPIGYWQVNQSLSYLFEITCIIESPRAFGSCLPGRMLNVAAVLRCQQQQRRRVTQFPRKTSRSAISPRPPVACCCFQQQNVAVKKVQLLNGLLKMLDNARRGPLQNSAPPRLHFGCPLGLVAGQKRGHPGPWSGVRGCFLADKGKRRAEQSRCSNKHPSATGRLVAIQGHVCTSQAEASSGLVRKHVQRHRKMGS